MIKSTRLLCILIVFGLLNSKINAQVNLKKTDSTWTLMVDGEPFDVKGATFGHDHDIENFNSYFKDLQFLGVNTIRIWGTNDDTIKLLDAAHKYNIKVLMGIWMRHGKPGMEGDDNFNYLEDTKGMEAIYKEAIEVVEKYKNHSAVLSWGVGNEVYLNIATDPEKEAYSKLLERICSKIKTLDPNHPITSVEAWTIGMDWWYKLVPSIDIYGLNSYGAGASLLAEELEKRGIDKPYIITEFGVTGEWDIDYKKNGIKVEPNDQQKYDAIAKGYHDWIKNKSSCLGVYVFHYGSGNNFGSPWLLTHHNGMYRPQYWAIREAYTGEKPINNVPVIETFELPISSYKSGSWVPVTLKVSDIENEKTEVNFYYNQRIGSRKLRDQLTPLNFRTNSSGSYLIQLPNVDSAIKVYVNVKDTYNNVGIASTSIAIDNGSEKKQKYLVPKATLPFYVYKDGEDMPYFPSAYMGNYKALEVVTKSKTDIHSGSASLKISYNQVYDWYGIGLVDPADDWGDILGGYDISGAETFSFWAKASDKNITATIGFGLIGKDKPYPDTAKKSIEVKLSTKWKRYTIKLKKLDMSCIRSGLVIFSSGSGSNHDIYFDNVVFE